MRECQTWTVKGGVEFNLNSRHLRLAKHLSMDPQRGFRSKKNRYLSDGTHNPAYVVEWAVGFQTDMLTVVSLSISMRYLG